ncbi:Nse1 non-SMC component of SMC5-6 complex-domain-containing protein [Schizophyllum amplum]|uniref:Non-structural maintenance of chromosomes element 1 homolog n=1 Tax=Schizophyllum amplum TaxID=97359 RepID=A0A550BYJ8_9AGAR|nr:Nse1 non-SMC component of SMC5-6 complex-domain-containing protein [Auriculariopsis ampla]
MVSAGDSQRLFLQGVLSRGILSEKLARILYTKCVDTVNSAEEGLNLSYKDSREEWETVVKDVNNALNALDLQFVRQVEQTKGIPMWGIVNMKGDEVAQVATDYSPVEIAYFKALVEQIIMAPRNAFSISSFLALREINELKPKANMTKSQGEETLASFVNRGWLAKSKRGRYALSTRTLIELKGYIKSEYPEQIPPCMFCDDFVTIGATCKCGRAIHRHCFTQWRNRRSQCKECNAEWAQNYDDDMFTPIGEDAVAENDNARRYTRQEEDDEDEDGETPSQSQSGSQKPAKKAKGKGRAKKSRASRGDDDMLVDDDEEVEAEIEDDEEDEADYEEKDDAEPPVKSEPRRRSTRGG